MTGAAARDARRGHGRTGGGGEHGDRRSAMKREHQGHRSRASEDRLAALVASMASLPRPVRVVKKRDHWHQRAAARALWLLTFGGQRTYLSHYVTTLGHTI